MSRNIALCKSGHLTDSRAKWLVELWSDMVPVSLTGEKNGRLSEAWRDVLSLIKLTTEFYLIPTIEWLSQYLATFNSDQGANLVGLLEVAIHGRPLKTVSILDRPASQSHRLCSSDYLVNKVDSCLRCSPNDPE
ncbi:hypothetical protein FGIG_06205 [Fasciola gigantica]|uniref:Uncharacterized protein n=1 Tax=Fasciola gigantica TaxID=46835 RepID=A0A504YJC9_FASGI|nr:hypothetical protein FGIG_06205 [Fasciola gigantica]